ncbi:glycosyltransferase family 4 protein [Paenibacillus athensensis]|uniref:Uncharacterized protein n=1 Tax=Paenibacillus athensensis TaxID=1967502 RepID=A0A4Y8PZ73_9BACL|nr:glycosyltransferase family 4 protein [Paenibacillus athensensis]MCD1259693.1 glycosyltransferase family 4 protein [Paenibacillus athensensis]
MRILIIAPEQNPVPPLVGSSVEHCIYQIAKQIPSSHHVTIVSRWRRGYPKTSVYGNVKIIRVQGATTSAYLRNVLNVIQGRSYDVIQIDNRPRFIPAVRKLFPHTLISIFLHSTTFISPPVTSRRQAASDLSYASRIIGNSRSLHNHLIKTFPEQSRKVRFVHLGVNPQQFRPRRSRRDGSSPFVVLFAGRLIPRKGLPLLMKAVKLARRSVPRIKLVIAGGTAKSGYKVRLKRIASSLGIPVVFKGYVSRSRMPRLYNTADCFVCPSQGHEAFGLVNVEAMASGVPVIASRNGGIPEIVRHERNGLLVTNYHSPAAFAKQIASLAVNHAKADRLARQARRDVQQRFTWRMTAKQLLRLYKA